MRSSRLLLASGLTIGSVAALVGLLVPGGGFRWFVHTPAGLLLAPLGVALIAAGAVVGRLEDAETATRALRGPSEPTPLVGELPAPDGASPFPIATKLSNERWG